MFGANKPGWQSTLEGVIQRSGGASKSRTFTVVAAAGVGLALLSLASGNIIIGSRNIRIGDTTITITNSADAVLKPWGSLPAAERAALKEAAIATCPEIAKIGKSTSWDCATKFLTDNGVHANNVRDLFR